MPLDQARQILGVESAAKAGSLTRELVLEQFTRHYEANDVEKGGSFYIQSKVWNAKEVLLEELKKKGYLVTYNEWNQEDALPPIVLLLSPQMQANYRAFGDCVSFDITYKVCSYYKSFSRENQ